LFCCLARPRAKPIRNPLRRIAGLQEVDRARASRDSRESQFAAAKARLALARRDLELSVLKAPFRGSISSRQIDPAQRIAAGETAFELDSAESGLRVEVQMPETLIDRVRQGDAARVGFPSLADPRFGAGRQDHPAVIAEVGTRAGVGNARTHGARRSIGRHAARAAKE